MGFGNSGITDQQSEAARNQATQSQQAQDISMQKQYKQGNGGSGLIGGIISGVTDLIQGDRNASRAWKQAKEAAEIQKKNQMELNDYNQALQMKTWHETNFGAQREELEKAGLSAGLMYGMSGGGGTTTGSTGSSASAPESRMQPTVNTAQSLGMGLQLELLKAQKENIEADTANKQAQTTKTAGVDTSKIQADTTLTGLQAENQKLQNEIQSKTLEQSIDTVIANYKKAEAEAGKAVAEGRWAYDKGKTEVAKLKQETINAGLQATAIKAGIQLTNEQTRAISVGLAQEWEELYQKGRANDNQAGMVNIAGFRAKLEQWATEQGLNQRDKQIMIQGANTFLQGISGLKGTTTTTQGETEKDGGYWERKTTK